MSGFSLWLTPSGSDESTLRTLVTRLSKETPADPPCLDFPPHLTLVNDHQVPALTVHELLEKVSEGVKHWKETDGKDGVELAFQDVRQGSHFYQCVMIAIKPLTPLMSLNATLRKTLPVPPDSPSYFPHISLIYGDLAEEAKQLAITKMKVNGDLLQGEAVEETTLVGLKSVRPVEVLLVRTSGPSTGWKVLGKVDLEDGKITEV